MCCLVVAFHTKYVVVVPLQRMGWVERCPSKVNTAFRMYMRIPCIVAAVKYSCHDVSRTLLSSFNMLQHRAAIESAFALDTYVSMCPWEPIHIMTQPVHHVVRQWDPNPQKWVLLWPFIP